MTCELQSTLEDSGIQWPASRNHIPCKAYVIQVALCAFMSCLGVKGHTKSWEAHERDQQFGQNEFIDIGNSQRLRKEGNARINKVSAMRPGLTKMIEKIRISGCFECPETNLRKAENACWIDYPDTWSLKQVHGLSNSQRPQCRTTYHWFQYMFVLDCGVTWASLMIARIHMWVAPKSELQRLLATLHNTGCMDNS